MEVLKRDVCKKYKVYLLLSKSMVYVDQSSDLSKRITQHTVSKNWWESVVILTTKDDSLTHFDIDYLESVLNDKAFKINCLDCDNKNKGSNRYYIAYGSNLNVRQMKTRCPKATILGTAKLKGWELLFKGSKTGSYLTIEENENGSVPVAIWKVTPSDEKALDRYEGYPNFYYKKDIKLQYKGIRTGKRRTINAFAYIMHEDRPIGVPSIYYMKTCLEGYDTFYFDRQILLNAYKNSMEMCENEK